MKTKRKDDLNIHDTDESVSKMLNNWDKIRCGICGKPTSLLVAQSVNGGEYFVCPSCAH